MSAHVPALPPWDAVPGQIDVFEAIAEVESEREHDQRQHEQQNDTDD